MKIKIVNLSDNPLPQYKTQGSAGMDLTAAEEIILFPGQIRAVETGLYVEIPEGYEGQVRSRSGLSIKGIVVNNSPGTIDSDFRGELKVILRNQSKYDLFSICYGDRIAQLVIAKVERCEWEPTEDVVLLEETERGEKGFGSTGL